MFQQSPDCGPNFKVASTYYKEGDINKSVSFRNLMHMEDTDEDTKSVAWNN
ncbi:hypothetical protein P3L10_019735 [Capsicum annuum]